MPGISLIFQRDRKLLFPQLRTKAGNNRKTRKKRIRFITYKAAISLVLSWSMMACFMLT
jgi:hypothetical protein